MSLLIRILPTKCGDSIVIKLDKAPVQNILIDSGYMDTYKTALKPQMDGFDKADENFKLSILTHLDADHINGSDAFVTIVLEALFEYCCEKYRYQHYI